MPWWSCAGNIWLHLAPLIFFLYQSLNPWDEAPWYFACAVIPCSVGLVCSVRYHTFMAGSSKSSYQQLLFVDYLSVFNTMIWPEAMVIGWSFACHDTIRQTALAGCLLSYSLATMLSSFLDCFALSSLMSYLAAYFTISAFMLLLAIRAKSVAARLLPFAGMVETVRILWCQSTRKRPYAQRVCMNSRSWVVG